MALENEESAVVFVGGPSGSDDDDMENELTWLRPDLLSWNPASPGMELEDGAVTMPGS